MIKILDLNNETLVDMRRENYIKIIENHKNKIDEFLDEDEEILPSFFSMLKQLLIKK